MSSILDRKLQPKTIIWIIAIHMIFCSCCCGMPLLYVKIFGPPFSRESGMFVIKNRSGSQIQILEYGSPKCWLKSGMTGCEMELTEAYGDTFTAKLLVNGKLITKTYEVKFGPGADGGLTTLAIDHQGEMSVESVVARQ